MSKLIIFIREEMDMVYDLMSGNVDPESIKYKYPLLANKVKNAYNSEQFRALEAKIFNARERLGNRLKTNIDDPDLVALADGYEILQRLFCDRMFLYAQLRNSKNHNGRN